MGNVLDVCEVLKFGENNEIKIDFIGRGNIWIKNTYKNDVISLARYILKEAILNTAPGQLKVTGLDSDLSALFAPFSSLSSGDAKKLEFLSDIKALEFHLDFLGEHIQAVQNEIQGKDGSLTAFRRRTGKPAQSYRFVVLVLNLSMVENKFLAKLSTILKKGPAAGVSFMIIPANNRITGGLTPHHLDDKITFIKPDGNRIVLLDHDGEPKNTAV